MPTHEQAAARTDVTHADPGFDVGVLCGSLGVGLAAALLVAFLNNRFNAPTWPSVPSTVPLGKGEIVAAPRDEPATDLRSTARAGRGHVPDSEVQQGSGSVGTLARPVDELSVDLGLVERLRSALSKTRTTLQEGLDRLFGRPVNDALFEALEETLLTADVGMPTTARIVERVRAHATQGSQEAAVLRRVMRDEMHAIMDALDPSLRPPPSRPWVILVVGVNGSGKTTTIGKLAARFVKEGKRVMLAAGDTYRAAASNQLEIWAERAGADIVSMEEGADPGAVVFDALGSACRKGHDVVIIDTAGRLQTRKPLMDQLGKVRRVIAKQVPDGPHETLLVVDGTMGQNGLSQARLFHDATPLTGVVVTKLDGTAKGGIVLAIASEMELPVKLIGIGEAVEDLRDFAPGPFVQALT